METRVQPIPNVEISKMKTLEIRRQITSLKLLFDIHYNLKFVDNHTKPEHQRSSNIKFKKQHGRLKVFENSYFYLVELQGAEKPIFAIIDTM